MENFTGMINDDRCFQRAGAGVSAGRDGNATGGRDGGKTLRGREGAEMVDLEEFELRHESHRGRMPESLGLKRGEKGAREYAGERNILAWRLDKTVLGL